jgi:hypothetical protein
VILYSAARRPPSTTATATTISMLKYVNIPVFIISLAVGLLLVYLYVPEKRHIYVYPTPETVDLLEYRDQAGNCFHFKQTPVDCPKNPDDITRIPPQH